jgi:hypothetical protein
MFFSSSDIKSQLSLLKDELTTLKTVSQQKWDICNEFLQKLAIMDTKAATHDRDFDSLKRDVSRIEGINRDGYNSNHELISAAAKELAHLDRKIEGYENQAKGMKQAGHVAIAIGVVLFSVIQMFVVNWVKDLESDIATRKTEYVELEKRVDETESQVTNILRAPGAKVMREPDAHTSGYELGPWVRPGFLQVADPIGGSSVPVEIGPDRLRLLFRGRVTKWPDGTPVTLVILGNERQAADFAWNWLNIPPHKFRDDLSSAKSQGRVSYYDAASEDAVIAKILKNPGGLGFVANSEIYKATDGITVIIFGK